MSDSLGLMEESNIEEKIREPFVAFFSLPVISQKKLTYSILKRENKDLILISSYGFCLPPVFAGLSEKHTEFIVKQCPKEYKEKLLDILGDQEKIHEVFEIAKAMDEDLGENVTKNQERVKNVIQYIKDNRIAFQF